MTSPAVGIGKVVLSLAFIAQQAMPYSNATLVYFNRVAALHIPQTRMGSC